MTIDWGEDYKEEEAEREAWGAVCYVSGECTKCGRQRVEKCGNGKHRCEKCFWVIEDARCFRADWER